MKIALAQINPTIGAFKKNAALITSMAKTARDSGCDLIVFPELSICGYPPRDLLEQPSFIKDCVDTLASLISNIKGIGVLIGTVTPNKSCQGKPVFNTAILFENGQIIGMINKRLLPSYDVFDETRYFEPGLSSTPILYKGTRLGIAICEDIWNDTTIFPGHIYKVDPVAELAEKGAEIFISISASPFEIGKDSFRYRLLRHLASTYKRSFIYVNTVGGQDSIVFDGASQVITPDGRIVCKASDFSEDMVIFDTDRLYGDIHDTSKSVEEAVVKALELALKDYMERCGFKKAVLGLSGGIDSSLTAVLAARTLGSENVLGVLMPSPFTSRESIEDAIELTRNIGIETTTVPITNIFETYLKTLRPIFSDRPFDTAEENLQARIRGAILMAISNKFGHMVLATGNKTELAVGYCTLYGDLTGGYALISDISKTFVYKLARYINSIKKVIPERIFTKPPSAELRPGQRDQDELPPYNILDAILELYIEKNATPSEITANGFDADVVRKIIGMVTRSEYKRQQAPPGPKVTTKAFGYGRRLPLANGYK
ncbi:MAG: NAD+ synthase [Dissulfurimicrobium sp.]|uniref:NAD+ synthase n=1 Tax=Dissulfurimicrobium TaxID=1769732 RepID=UPI001EDBF9D7|nr:NAD+ synthase [Dissulfurimicrobium hydrothermale]UKL13368.1 NAD+ synthase [Dissulfurimicrobium hydrothermale]